MNIHTYAELLRIVICTTVCISYNSVKLTSHPQLCYNKKKQKRHFGTFPQSESN